MITWLMVFDIAGFGPNNPAFLGVFWDQWVYVGRFGYGSSQIRDMGRVWAAQERGVWEIKEINKKLENHGIT